MFNYFIKIVLGFWNLLRGMAVTIVYFQKQAVTIQYPKERWKLPQGYRGKLRLTVDDNGKEKCTGCLACARICPTGAIKLKTGQREDKKRFAEEFSIDNTLCMFCGLCVESCNFDAIVHSKAYEYSSSDRKDLILDKAELLLKTGEKA